MSFIYRVVGRRNRSAQVAKERLQLVLIHDRTDISPVVLDALKDDLLEAVSRHVDVDPAAVRIDVTRDGRSQRLVADIPLRSASRRRTG